MATNLDLDPDLIERAVALSGAPTKKAAVTAALQEFIARREQGQLLELFGKLEWDPAYGYKRERSRDRACNVDTAPTTRRDTESGPSRPASRAKSSVRRLPLLVQARRARAPRIAAASNCCASTPGSGTGTLRSTS